MMTEPFLFNSFFAPADEFKKRKNQILFIQNEQSNLQRTTQRSNTQKQKSVALFFGFWHTPVLLNGLQYLFEMLGLMVYFCMIGVGVYT